MRVIFALWLGISVLPSLLASASSMAAFHKLALSCPISFKLCGKLIILASFASFTTFVSISNRKGSLSLIVVVVCCASFGVCSISCIHSAVTGFAFLDSSDSIPSCMVASTLSSFLTNSFSISVASVCSVLLASCSASFSSVAFGL